MNKYKTTTLIFDKFQSVEPYRDDWNNLSVKQKNPLISFEWFSCCASAFHYDDRLYIVCAINNDELIAAAPLYMDKNDFHLKIIGSRRLHEPSSILFKDEISLNILLNACIKIGSPILFSRFFYVDFYKKHLSCFSLRGLYISRNSTRSQYLELKTDFESYENSLTSRKRYDIRRAIKKANEYGMLEYDIIHVDPYNATSLLQKAYDVENLGWKHRSKSSIKDNNDLNNFFSCLYNFIARNNKGVIAFLSIDKKLVATQIALHQFNCLWILKIGYDERYASCSPGVILMHEMIRHAHEKGFDKFEFLGSEEAWMNSWKPVTRNYYNHFLYPLSIKGVAGFLSDVIRILIDKIKVKF